MKLNRLVLLGAAVLTAFTLTACDDKKAAPQNTAAEKQYNIGVVQLVEHKALDEANKGFVDALAARGFKEGKKTSSLTSKTLRPTNLILEILRSVLQATRLT